MGSRTNKTKERGGLCYKIWYWGDSQKKSHTKKMSLSCILKEKKLKKKKNEHTFLVFLYIFVNNILLEIISKHIMASSKNKGYNMRKMNVLWGIYNATLLGVDVFLQKKKERNTFAFWWVICSIIVNTGSVKWLYNMSKLYYKYSHYIHETHVPAFFFFFYALVIWGIFRSIFLSFFPPSISPTLFFFYSPLL